MSIEVSKLVRTKLSCAKAHLDSDILRFLDDGRLDLLARSVVIGDLLLVDPVRLLIVGFVCCPRKETKFVVWILELFWIYVRLFTATRLRLPVLLSGQASSHT